jgi:hypothetical protein
MIYIEHGGYRFLRNVGNHQWDYTFPVGIPARIDRVPAKRLPNASLDDFFGIIIIIIIITIMSYLSLMLSHLQTFAAGEHSNKGNEIIL